MMEGTFRKQSQHFRLWNERYFRLEGSKLIYFLSAKDATPRGIFEFTSNCEVGNIEHSKTLFHFTITFPPHGSIHTKKTLSIGFDTNEYALEWRRALLASILASEKNGAAATREAEPYDTDPIQSPNSSQIYRKQAGKLLGSLLKKGSSCFKGEFHFVELFDGIRILQEKSTRHGEMQANEPAIPLLFMIGATCILAFSVALGFGSVSFALLITIAGIVLSFYYNSRHLITEGFPSFKISIPVGASALEVFERLIDAENLATWDISIESACQLRKLDDNSDIIQISFAKRWIWPLYLQPKDLCLLRYWRQGADGTFYIFMQSIKYPECHGENNGFDICNGAGFIISPRRQDDEISCLVSQVTHVDPGRWTGKILQLLGLALEYMKPQILALRGLSDAIDESKFVAVNFEELNSNMVLQSSDSTASLIAPSLSESGSVDNHYPEVLECSLPREMWGEPEVGSMLVRGPDYLRDRRKVPSAAPAFKLVAVDLFKTDGPVEHIASHPDNLVQKEIAKYDAMSEEMPFTFLVNFIIPGSHHYSVVTYFQCHDKSVLTEVGAFSELFSDFINGDDEFRDERFKLIPCVVDGTFIIRQAVGSTPAIIGKKLRQPYYQGSRYFELDIDICSSRVANQVTGLVIGVTKKLVIDMGFVLQGQSPDELPERLLGAIRLKHVNLDAAVQLQPSPTAT